MSTTTTSVIAPADRTFYNKTLLVRALSEKAYEQFGQQDPVSLYSGDQPKWRQYGALTDPVAPLAEGVTPTAQAWSNTDYTGQLVEYGTFVELSDYVQWTSNDGKKLLTELSETLGETMGSTKNKICRDTIVAGTSVFYAGSVTARVGILTIATETDISKITRALAGNNAKLWKMAPIMGSDKVGTKPISGSYYAVCHTDTTYDLFNISNFTKTHEYADGGKSALPGEIGSLGKVRFIESTDSKIWADTGGAASTNSLKYTTASTAADVYGTMIFGQNAFGITPLTGHSSEMIVKSLGSGNDPLNQRSTGGFKFVTDTVILNEDFMYRYEHGVSE